MLKKIVLAGSLILITLAATAQKKEYKSLSDAFMSGMSLRGESGPSGVNWIGNGSTYSFSKKEGRTQQIWSYSIEKEAEELVFNAGDFTFPGTEENFSYRSSQWAGDYQYLLFQTNFEKIWRNSGNSDYYYYSLKEQSMMPIIEDAFTAEVSPDGNMVGYGKEGNLFTFDLASGKHTQLTDDGADKFYNGRFGWANEEEFGLVQAWEWSNDSKFIAFWQSDEREVPIYQLTDFSGQHPEYMQIPYPKVGDNPPVERLGILNVESGEKSWLDLDPEGGYMPRIYWTARENTLAVVWMNRAQNHLKLYTFDVLGGEKKMIMEEKSETWIDIFDFFAGEMHLFYFPTDMESFFWISDRTGYSHIYEYDYEGKLLNQSTDGDYDVVSIKGIDSKKKVLYYLSCEISPMERNIYSSKFNGKGKKRITSAEGNHRVNMSPNGKYFIDSYSDITTPSTVDLRDGKGELITTLAGHERARAHLEAFKYAGKELFTFTNSDGQTIDGYLIKPMNFNPAKSYPLIMDVYGGPGAQGVYNTFETSGWHQWLAQNGFVVANINNRGSGGYGSAFEKCVYLHLGKLETEDFAEAALFLAENSWVDGENIAIAGHSFGGLSAGISLLTHGDVFKAGIVAAATANHLNYDNIYTERYMGLIDQNAEGYKQSSMITHAGNLEGEMMLVHGLMDDNVHPQNAFQLLKALIDNEKSVDLKIFPPGTHGVAYDMKSRIFLYSEYMEFFEKNLK
ncbi:MAG: DPP IV N-terminal domain-containing protein [Bacteroides sp.]|nr:DPP IV N-terminal domain-containing protein [Bacteroides sp.]